MLTDFIQSANLKINFMFESEIITDITNQSSDQCFGANLVFGGPTKVDFSMLPTPTLIPTNEGKLLKSWKQQDLAKYHKESRSNYYK